jgi:hypothetical protein
MYYDFTTYIIYHAHIQPTKQSMYSSNMNMQNNITFTGNIINPRENIYINTLHYKYYTQ